jgi:two-component system, NtrC family, response regulator
MAAILIIDDDPIICDILMKMMDRITHKSRFSLTGSQGLDLAKNNHFDLIFLDVNLPDANGLDLIKSLKSISSSPEIIIITGESDPDGAELAIQSGVWNYLEKPFFRHEITLQVTRALEFRKEKGRVSGFGGLNRSGIIGDSELMRSCLEQVRVAAYSDIPVLISGEPGVGKQLFAKTIHLNSEYGNRNFVVVDCSALGEGVADKLLYGSIDDLKDGKENRSGLVDLADKGTLFLDDISRLPVAVGKSILRAMEGSRSVSVRDKEKKSSHFRVIASTCQRVDPADDKSFFQNDLISGQKGIHIRLPSLRQIKQDTIAIAIHYIDWYCKKYEIAPKGISPACLDILSAYHWPGNVRELINAMGKAVASAKNEPTLYSVHLPSHIRSIAIKKRTAPDMFKDGFLPLKTFTQQWELYYLKHLFEHVAYDVQKVCEISGVSKSSIYSRLKRYNIT